MHNIKITAGAKFPELIVKNSQGNEANISIPLANNGWKMIIVYRGQHCPLCTKYLNALEQQLPVLNKIGVDLVAVSADSQVQLKGYLAKLDVSFPFFYGLSIVQMQQLGLYISIPRSEQETDHNFSEPGLFVINSQGNVQVVDISNNPFARPAIETLINGLIFIRNPENNYPIRGTFQ